jgi:hypothetical protein
MSKRASQRTTKRHATKMTTHVKKGAHRGAWIGAAALVGVGAVAVLLLTEKKASASTGPSGPPGTPGTTPPAPGAGPSPTTPLQTAAYNMAVALQSNGYRQSDQSIYEAFQTAAGLSPVDGFPGTGTMAALGAALQSFGSPYPFVDGYTAQTIVVYPWSAAGGYNGTTAPPAAEWNR